MPVDDHPIHPSTQKGKDFRYGCWNRKPFAKSYPAPNRKQGQYCFHLKTVHIPHVMSTDCKYDLSHKDAACEGCKHKETK